eukprot:RCo052334
MSASSESGPRAPDGGGDDALFCAVCSREGGLRCTECKDVRYCCRACAKVDWKLHKLLCSATIPPALQDSGSPAAGSSTRSVIGLLLPADSSTPVLLQVPLRGRTDCSSPRWSVDLPELFPEPPSTLLVCTNPLRLYQKLRSTLVIHYRESPAGDASTHKGVEALVGYPPDYQWTGPVVVTRALGVVPESVEEAQDFADFRKRDLLVVGDYLRWYRAEGAEHWGDRNLEPWKVPEECL